VADITGTYLLGTGAGRILVKTARTGLAARAGHDLTIEITRWSARVAIPAEDGGGIAAAEITADLDLGSLAVREGTGGVKPLTDKDRRDIENNARKILGQGTASFAATRLIPAAAGGEIEGTVTFHGRSQPVRLQVASPAPGRYRGSATVLQTGFGITPYSGFFGALKLSDEITVEFDVDLDRGQRE
jgi:hypothetical protein